ncbi:extensin family protein [Chelativorans sp. Marseille-P2723]|uniref:extensin-like domain-containing protein n=1 Tax=Chelativorans sp. Marseille-P2723 TaxID=2709133 RepID=UPI00156EFFBC|nr:extensin family protein [Chelativorans sp. Marseille-P2723]
MFKFGGVLPFGTGKVALAAIGFSLLLIISACSVDSVLRPEVDVGVKTASVAGTGLRNVLPSSPMTTAYPRIMVPQPGPGAQMPAEEVACRRELKRLGVVYRDLALINDGGECRIDYPVEVSGLAGRITMQPPATLTCNMAVAVAQWTRAELAPAARTRYLSGIDTIRQGSSYSCRRIRGTSVASEHSKGNALDIMSIRLKNGREIDVRKPGFFAFRQKSLLNKVRAQGCGYFTTVLGPGYDADHKDHFHFDIKNRRNGHRACR